MISAVDTNLLIDIINPDEPYAETSIDQLRQSLRRGLVIIAEPVYSELAAYFPGAADLNSFLSDLRVRLQPSTEAALHQAGSGWADYSRRRPRGITCPQCGASQAIRCRRCDAVIRPRQHILADFLIGAHALVQADRLLTRDRGFYSTYFPDLTLA